MKKNLKEKILAHGLSFEEYSEIIRILSREPNEIELGIFSVMWSEHCSYKSTKKWLKTLPTAGKKVICGPGENAGIIDFGSGDAIVFKMESHNHPSFIEPYQGAATGVGGIMRDIFTMGARPIANVNSLRFGDISNKNTRFLLSGVVKGIGDYGNCVGIPTVGGECFFHKSYNNNILVNAMCVGLVKKNKIFYSKAKGIGYPLIYVGSKTGRDGIHGATMASAEFSDDSSENRPQVQVGDPFMEKLLLESCLELMKGDAIVAIQDMGAAGLTSSSFEMASKGNCGVELFLDTVPCRETNMKPYEIMLSETQERMLMIINPKKKKITLDIFKKWGLDAIEIGRITNSGKMEIFFNKEKVCSLPIKPLADNSPEYSRPYKKKKITKVRKKKKLLLNIRKMFLELISNHNFASKSWIFNQYDSSVMGDTIKASEEADAAVIRIHGSKKGIAITSDCNPIYCNSDPKLGAKIAVAEAWRNLVATGSEPIAITNNLNFGNPEKPEIMYQIKKSIDGIKEACKFLQFPVVSGNVSLYNETKGKAIMPTPVIGGVGKLKNWKDAIGFKVKEGQKIYLVGNTRGHLELSALHQHFKIFEGSPPRINLSEELNNGNFISDIIHKYKQVKGCHDISEGGIIISLAEISIYNQIGVDFFIPNRIRKKTHWLFGEDTSRYLVFADQQNNIKDISKRYNVKVECIGKILGDVFKLKNHFEIKVKELVEKNNFWFKNYMK